MKKSRLVQIALPAIIVGLGWVIFNAANAHDDHHKGKTRAASAEQLMEGLVNPNCKSLAKQLKADEPNWKKVRLYAAMMNESGYVLMDDKRCPDKIWAGASKAMQKHSVTIMEKAKAKDAEGVNAAFKLLTTEGCGACHKKHKKH